VRAAPDLTLREALAAFRQANGLPADETASASWTCRLGPLTLRLPNFTWRRRAILAHDLHHVLTGYPCTLRGECQMAAWEFAAGRMPHPAAALFCLPLLPLGLIWTPRRMLRAFRRGRRSRSLHESKAIDRLLAAPLQAARVELVAARTRPWPDRVRFALLILQAAVIFLAPFAFSIGLLLLALAAA
jgi:hypothetical protein